MHECVCVTQSLSDHAVAYWLALPLSPWQPENLETYTENDEAMSAC